MYQIHILSMKMLLVLAFTFCAVNSAHNTLKIISRSEWKAAAAKANLVDLKLPVPNVIVAHTDTEPCHTKEDCIYRTERIQQIHMGRGFDDIGYNFLIGGDGNVYEGRGWKKAGAHTKGYNLISIGIAFIGRFNTVSPNNSQLDAAKHLIAEGLKHNEISKAYKLYGQRTLTETYSPGDHLFGIIKKWPHFTDQRHPSRFFL